MSIHAASKTINRQSTQATGTFVAAEGQCYRDLEVSKSLLPGMALQDIH